MTHETNTTVNRSAMSRRQLLRAGGALVALPFMESLFPRRLFGATEIRPPVRLGIFTVTGGTVLESWKPAQSGTLGKLPSILRPLEFAKDDLTIVSGLANTGRGDNVNGHQHCAFLHLTAAPSVRNEAGKIVAGVSVDQFAAQRIGQQTLLPSLEMGLAGAEQKYSFRAADSVVPYEANPRLLFDRHVPRPPEPSLPIGAAAARRKPLHRAQGRRQIRSNAAVLDVVLAQANDLRRGLGRTDQGKLDQYLDAVRAVEKRIALAESRQREDLLDLAQPGSSQPKIPGGLPKPGASIWEVTRPLNEDPARHADYIRLIADLMVLAFQTDTTRVATLALGSDESMFPGVVTVGYERHCHTLEHQGNSFRVEDADPIAREACRQIHAWYTSLFAETIRKMQAIDEGGSSLLDNSLILYTSYMADGGHGRNDYPSC